MANLNKLTDDEYVMLTEILVANLLTDKLAELTSFSVEQIKHDASKFCSGLASSMSDLEVRKLLKVHRDSIEQCRQITYIAR